MIVSRCSAVAVGAFLSRVCVCQGVCILCAASVRMEKCVCVIFSASLDSCPLVSVGDEVNFLLVNRGRRERTHTHTCTQAH